MQVKSTAGEIIDLSDKLGGGGEALGVFSLAKDPSLCAKIYKDEGNAARLEKKVEAMIDIYKAVRVGKGEAERFFDKHLAWPRLKLYGMQSGKFSGFIMNKLPLYAELSGLLDEDMGGEKCWGNRLEIAASLLKILRFLHGNGIIVGDLHKGNVFVLPNNEAALVDCDSFQIGDKFQCSALQPEIAPPEAKYVPYFEPVADVFSAATLIYRLLMDGFNPFQFIRDGSLNPDLEQSKASGFAPIRDAKIELPPKSPPLERLPKEARVVIAEALDPDPQKRPSLEALMGAVDEIKRRVHVPLPAAGQGRRVVPAVPSVDAPKTPKLTISRTAFDFTRMRKGKTASGRFTISNVGTGLLIGSITTNNAWLKTSRNDIDVTRSRQDIEFIVNTSGLDPGFKDVGTIRIQSNGGAEQVSVHVSVKATTLALPITLGIVGIVGLCTAYTLRKMFTPETAVPRRVIVELPVDIHTNARQKEAAPALTPERALEAILPEERPMGEPEAPAPQDAAPKEVPAPQEKQVEKTNPSVAISLKLSEKLRKGAYLSWQKPDGYEGKTSKRSVVTAARIERADAVLKIKYGSGYAGSIDCTWTGDPGTYVGTWRDKGGDGKIQLTPLLDDEGAIVSFVGYQQDGSDAPKMPTRITSYRPTF